MVKWNGNNQIRIRTAYPCDTTPCLNSASDGGLQIQPLSRLAAGKRTRTPSVSYVPRCTAPSTCRPVNLTLFSRPSGTVQAPLLAVVQYCYLRAVAKYVYPVLRPKQKTRAMATVMVIPRLPIQESTRWDQRRDGEISWPHRLFRDMT